MGKRVELCNNKWKKKKKKKFELSLESEISKVAFQRIHAFTALKNKNNLYPYYGKGQIKAVWSMLALGSSWSQESY